MEKQKMQQCRQMLKLEKSKFLQTKKNSFVKYNRTKNIIIEGKKRCVHYYLRNKIEPQVI